LFLQCTENIQHAADVPVINIQEPDSVIEFRNYFKNFEIYEFETNEVIAEFSYLIEIGDKFLIKGEDSEGNRLFLFDLTTNNLEPIAKIGKGPKEFKSVKYVDQLEDNYGILDYWNKSITKYNLNTIETVELRLPSAFEAFKFIDTSNIALYKSVNQISTAGDVDEYKLTIINSRKENEIINSFFKIDPVLCWERTPPKSNLYRYKDLICYYETFQDTLYTVLVDKVIPRYIFNRGENQIPKSIMSDSDIKLGEFMHLCKNSNYIYGISNINESTNFVFFTYIRNNQLYYSFYDKNKGITQSSSKIHDNLLFKTAFPIYTDFLGIKPIGGNEKHLIFTAEPYFIKRKIELIKKDLNNKRWETFKKDNPRLLKFFENSSISDNPVIIKYIFI